MEEKPTIEGMMASIEETIAKLEADDVTLDEAFALYQDGIASLKACNAMMDDVEKKVQILSADGTLTDFEGE